jgi:outer membrane immunogenic protein
MEEKKMTGKLVVAAVVAVLLSAAGAMAQEGPSQEVAVQGTGFFTNNATRDGIFQHATDTGGVLASYRYHFNRWVAADVSYGYIRNMQQNFTSTGAFNVQANVHQATAAVVVTLPVEALRLKPYLLAGSGALIFQPTNNAGGFVAGTDYQAKPVFVYGGGADFALTKHFSLRAEYRGLVYTRPDFGLRRLNSGATTHTAQPSAGIVFRF